MPSYTDQCGHHIVLDHRPSRIVSLVPSQTELLYDLGLDKEVVGITKFCVHPPAWFSSKCRVGGTKTVHFDRVAALQPDLIIANKEENTKDQVDALAAAYPVWTSDISNLPQALDMIERIGHITQKSTAAKRMTAAIRQGFSQLPALPVPVRTAYLIWQNPYMTVGGDTFIHDMLSRCGFDNIFKDRQRYPVISLQDLAANDCRLLLLSSEPFPFKQQHIDKMQQELPATKIMLADGEMFSWYGSRLLQAPGYFEKLRQMTIADFGIL